MHKLLLSSLVPLVLALLLPSAASAQGAITPGTPTVVYTRTGDVRVYWDPCVPPGPLPANAISKYELAAFTSLTGGVRKTTWHIAPTSAPTFEVPGAALERATVLLSVRCWTESQEASDWSNSLPFEPAGIPGAPGRLRTTANAP